MPLSGVRFRLITRKLTGPIRTLSVAVSPFASVSSLAPRLLGCRPVCVVPALPLLPRPLFGSEYDGGAPEDSDPTRYCKTIPHQMIVRPVSTLELSAARNARRPPRATQSS